MPSEWCMVAYLLDGRALQNLNEKINFDDGLTLGPIDQWMREQSILADIGRFQRGYVRSARHTISITYEADSHEDESQQLALERLCLVNESLWLAAPCSVSFRGCFGLQSVDGAWVPQAAPIGPPLTAFYSYAGHVLTKAEIDLARRVYRALARLPRGGSLHQVHGLLWRALITESWDIRFIFLWIVLEALFGSESATGEVAFRLSSRLALFLESEGAGARALYDDAKKSYNVRSRIVHGLRLKNLPDDQADRYMGSLERWVRDSLVKVVLDDRLRETFAGNGREAYLEGLMFGDGGEVAILPSTLSEP